MLKERIEEEKRREEKRREEKRREEKRREERKEKRKEKKKIIRVDPSGLLFLLHLLPRVVSQLDEKRKRKER